MLVVVVVVVQVGQGQGELVQVDPQVRDWDRDEPLLVGLVLGRVVAAAVLRRDAHDQAQDEQTDDDLWSLGFCGQRTNGGTG